MLVSAEPIVQGQNDAILDWEKRILDEMENSVEIINVVSINKTESDIKITYRLRLDPEVHSYKKFLTLISQSGSLKIDFLSDTVIPE